MGKARRVWERRALLSVGAVLALGAGDVIVGRANALTIEIARTTTHLSVAADGTLRLGGRAAPEARVAITLGGKAIGLAIAEGDGRWRWSGASRSTDASTEIAIVVTAPDARAIRRETLGRIELGRYVPLATANQGAAPSRAATSVAQWSIADAFAALVRLASPRMAMAQGAGRETQSVPSTGPAADPPGFVTEAVASIRQWLEKSRRDFEVMAKRLAAPATPQSGVGQQGAGNVPVVAASRGDVEPSAVRSITGAVTDWLSKSGDDYRAVARRLADPTSPMPVATWDPVIEAAQRKAAEARAAEERQDEQRRRALELSGRPVASSAETKPVPPTPIVSAPKPDLPGVETARKLAEIATAEAEQRSADARRFIEAEKLAAEKRRAEEAQTVADTEARAAADRRAAEARRIVDEARREIERKAVEEARRLAEQVAKADVAAREALEASRLADERRAAEKRTAQSPSAADGNRASATGDQAIDAKRREEVARMGAEASKAADAVLAAPRPLPLGQPAAPSTQPKPATLPPVKPSGEPPTSPPVDVSREAAAAGQVSVTPSTAGAPATGSSGSKRADRVTRRADAAMSGKQVCLVAAGKTVRLPGAYIVKRGDTLWHIAERHYDSGLKYKLIYAANRDRIVDPDLIYPCQKVRMPRRP